MTEAKKMWTALEAHQPMANRLGYSEAWARMCSERTADAAYAAADAADVAATAAWNAPNALVYFAANAADAAWTAPNSVVYFAAADAANAAHAAARATDAGYYFNKAISHITEANQGEQA